MKAVAWLAVAVTLVASGAYTAVSLARWEWNRALFFGLVFLAAEVGLASALVLRRLSRAEERLAPRGEVDYSSAAAIRAARRDHERFDWLRTDPAAAMTRSNVFITLMVGGGVLLSGGAWLLDRLASGTLDPGREARLNRDLEALAYPQGLLADDVTALASPETLHDDPRVHALLRRR